MKPVPKTMLGITGLLIFALIIYFLYRYTVSKLLVTPIDENAHFININR